jgi:hypothetical protein
MPVASIQALAGRNADYAIAFIVHMEVPLWYLVCIDFGQRYTADHGNSPCTPVCHGRGTL